MPAALHHQGAKAPQIQHCSSCFAHAAYVLPLTGAAARHVFWRPLASPLPPPLQRAVPTCSCLGLRCCADGVRATATKLVLASYFLLSIVIMECYAANLSAFLTVTQLQASVQSLADLRGRAVGTTPVYTARVARHGIAAAAYAADDVLLASELQNTWLNDLRSGVLAAFIYDEPILAWVDRLTDCSITCAALHAVRYALRCAELRGIQCGQHDLLCATACLLCAACCVACVWPAAPLWAAGQPSPAQLACSVNPATRPRVPGCSMLPETIEQFGYGFAFPKGSVVAGRFASIDDTMLRMQVRRVAVHLPGVHCLSAVAETLAIHAALHFSIP